jgi:Zn-dependent protease
MIDARTALIVIAGFVVAIAVHEFSHAFAAWSLGDSTAQRAGRLTLNPLRHLDPFGTLLLLLTLFSGVPGIGWGKPVPVDPRALRFGRAGMAVVSAAGPLSNLAIALLMGVLVRIVVQGDLTLPRWGVDFVLASISWLILLNVGLCVFNLLPVPPLDGFGVAVGVLPWSLAGPLARLARYGPAILLLLVFSGSLIRVDLLGMLLGPPRAALLALVQRVAGIA